MVRHRLFEGLKHYRSKGFKEYKNEDSDCSLVRNKTCIDFWNNSNNTWKLTIWTDNLM